MATTTNWVGTTSTDWFAASNWDNGAPINNTFYAVIGTTASFQQTIGGAPMLTINTLTINGTDTLTIGDGTSGNGVFLTVANGIGLSGGGTIAGQGKITGNVMATGAATIRVKAVNGQSTPQLEFFGTITDSGGQLTLALDGGVTKLADFGVNSDPSDFLNSSGLTPSDSFSEFNNSTTFQSLTSINVTMSDIRGVNITAAAANFWVSEGPSPGINGQETVSPNNQIEGAIQAIAVDPTNANIMYVGSVNGGIWKTTNATAAAPHWVPLTDNLPSLSIGALEFDPTDATHQTLIAGIGSTSSYFLNDQFTGVLRSTDGGVTWSQLGTAAAALGGENITSVAARGSILLAAADNAWGGGLGKGLFRSTDSGATWTLISDGTHGLPNLTPVSDIVGDPLNSNILYAAVTGASGGVFKSTDNGLTWTSITSGIGIIGSTTIKIELAVHNDGTNLAVFATVDNFSNALNDNTLSGVFRSLNGGSFVALDVPSGGTQGNLHGAIQADPNSPNIVYVGLGGGSTHYLTRIDASKAAGSQITDISGGSFGSPHVDTREMQIDANGNLILGTDGGLFRLPTPTGNAGAWSAIVGDISVFEFHSIAYDHVSHVIMGGAQDNGTLIQQTQGGATWDHPGFGDGGDVTIDSVSLAASGKSIRYFSSQNLGGWERQVYDSANKLVSTTSLASIPDPRFTTPVALNNVDPTRLLVGGSGHIYQSLNQGTSLTAIATLGVNDIGFGGGDMMVYGGFKGAVADADLIYAGSGTNVLVQTTAGGGFTSTSPGGGGSIRGVTDNPINWAIAFAIDDNQVFESTNAGGTWVDVTVNLTSISAADLRSITYVRGTLDDALVVGTSSGVFFAKVSVLGGAASWSKFGGNLPDVIVYDLAYDAADNVLVAGTMGRGAWLVNNATINLGITAAGPPNWLGTTSSDWFTAFNWNTGVVPTSADDVTISTTPNFQPAIPLSKSATVNTLTMNGDTLTLGDNSGTGNSQGLTATNGFTLNGGTIQGQGSLTGNITVTGVGAVTLGLQVLNNQNTPQFEIFGTITDTLGVLTLVVGNDNNTTTNLNPGELILTKNSQAHAVTFQAGGGAVKAGHLVLQDAGPGLTLTVATQMAIGAGTVFLAGANPGAVILNDAAGATISTGTILGIGKFNAALTATGAATILTNSGLLELNGSITDTGGALTLSIANAADKLFLNGNGPATANAVTFGATGTLEMNAVSLVVASAIAIGDSTVQMDNTSSTLTDAAGLTLTTGKITGSGNVSAPIAASDAAHITALGGTLELGGVVSDNGGKLVMDITGSGDKLLIDALAGAKTLNFLAGGTLEIGSAASVGIADALAIGAGTVKLDGAAAALIDLNGISLSTGNLTGAGLVKGNVVTSGAAHITATGGTLELEHPDGGAAAVMTITGSSDTLQLDFNGAAKTVDFNGKSGTLKIHNIGGTNFTVTDKLVVGSGTIVLDTAQSALTDTAGITLNFGNIIGFGKITGVLNGTGNVAASGGALELVTALGNATGTTFQINTGASTILQLDGKAGTNNTFAFLGASGVLGLGDDTGFDNTIVGLNVGAGLTPTNFVDIEGKAGLTVLAPSVTGQGTTSGSITLSDGSILHLSNISAPNWNAYTVTDGKGGTEVFLSNTPCFCRGTLILTEEGEVAVEDLKVGDLVRTLSGALKPVVWIGFGRDLVTRRNSLARPIIVRQGALADNVPARDLYLTHGHGVYLDSAIGGVLIPVENLINHRSILWDESAQVVEYYHVELEDHDVLLANGAPAESYYDADNRALFHNTRPGSIEGEAKPTYAPVLNGGEVVERSWAKLYQRCGGQIASVTTDDPDPHLILAGARLDPAVIEEGVYSFALASPPADALNLASRSAVPSLLGITAHDHRRLGLAIRRIVIAQPGVATAIEHDAPLFAAAGVHPPEAGYSWTDGELTLPAHLFAHLTGPFTLTVHTERPGGMRYPRDGGGARAQAAA